MNESDREQETKPPTDCLMFVYAKNVRQMNL